MATIEQEIALRNELNGVLEELAKLTPGELARKDLTAELSFESGVVFCSRTLRLYHALSDANLEDIPTQRLNQLRDVARNDLQRLREVRNFTLQKYANNPIQMRDQFIAQIRDTYDQTFEAVAPITAFTIRKGTDFERLEEQGKQTLQRIDASSKAQEAAMQQSRERAEQMVEAVRKITQEAGVSQHFIHFRDEAELNAESAEPWLAATITLASVTAVLGIGLIVWYLFRLPALTPSQSVQLAIPKIFIFSVLLSATVWAGRTYRAYRHNVVVNRHRQNALATFEAFAKAASDTETKNAVLLQATQCIFSQQPTGYIHSEPEAGAPQVLEIVRDLGKVGR